MQYFFLKFAFRFVILDRYLHQFFIEFIVSLLKLVD
jgi:hypothetical protein